MNYWLVKQEPATYSYDKLEREKKTVWDGVRNNLALKHIRQMKKGDRALFYHSGGERQAVGMIEIASNPYPDPKGGDDRFVVVDVKPLMKMKRPVTLDEIKKDPKFKNWELLRISRLSVMPVPANLWKEIVAKSKG